MPPPNQRKQHWHIAHATYRMIHRQCPELSRQLIKDLLSVEGYSDIAIAFAAKIPIDTIRAIHTGRMRHMPQQLFFRLWGLHAKVFCKKWDFDIDNPEGEPSGIVDVM